MMVHNHPDLDAAVARSLAQARAEGRSASTYDLFGALIRVAEVERMVRDTGGDVEALALGLASAAADSPRPAGPLARWWSGLVPATTTQRMLGIATQQRASSAGRELRPVDVFVAGFVAGDARLRMLLEEAGLSRLRLLKWLVGGGPESVPDGEVLDVVALNDDYTKMETVVRILETVFPLDAGRAVAIMLAVHRQGQGRVGRFERAEAIRLTGAATALAEAEGAPLRVVLRPPEEAPDPVPAPLPTPPEPRHLLAAVAARLFCRAVPVEPIASSDGVIALTALAALAVWLVGDRLAAGPAPNFYPGGATGIVWYAAGVVALAFVLHRTSAPSGEFRHVLAAVGGGVRSCSR